MKIPSLLKTLLFGLLFSFGIQTVSILADTTADATESEEEQREDEQE